MFSTFFSRRQSQRSLHPAGSSWRYLIVTMSSSDWLIVALTCEPRRPPLDQMSCCVFKTKLLKKAMTMLDSEKQIRKDERERILAERVPELQMSGLSLQDLQVSADYHQAVLECNTWRREWTRFDLCDLLLQNLCKELHQKIDVVDEERYDINAKVVKNDMEVGRRSQPALLNEQEVKNTPNTHCVESSTDNCNGFVCLTVFNTKIQDLSGKIFELKGKMKRPNLRRVRVSADAMLGALLGAKVKESVDFKANLKTVKKEEEKVRTAAFLTMLQEKHGAAIISFRVSCLNVWTDLETPFLSHRKRRWLTGVRTWTPCLGWRAGRSCLTLASSWDSTTRCLQVLLTWP